MASSNKPDTGKPSTGKPGGDKPGSDKPGGGAHSRTSRQQIIVDHVFAAGSSSIVDLAELTGVSHMTVHRDVDDLARRGLVRKYRGGVSAMPSTVFESNAEYRMTAHAQAKTAIARKALEHVEPGMSILLDDSTSALALAKLLGDVAPLTVATNYVEAIQQLKQHEEIRLICIGGDYSSTHDSFLGMQSLEAIERLSADAAFVSTSAMTTEMTYHQEPEIVMIKRAMLAAARQKVLLMDASKFGRTALHRLAPLDGFDLIVVDAGTDPATVDELRSRTKVEVAPPAR